MSTHNICIRGEIKKRYRSCLALLFKLRIMPSPIRAVSIHQCILQYPELKKLGYDQIALARVCNKVTFVILRLNMEKET